MVHGLKKQGYMVAQAGNGEEGLQLMQSQMFNMVLSDIMMPVMDGLECAKRLREWEHQQGAKRTPQFICALSANTDAADIAKVSLSCAPLPYPVPLVLCMLVVARERSVSLVPVSTHACSLPSAHMHTRPERAAHLGCLPCRLGAMLALRL
jgi:CheY-like chemotaxis protein